MSFWTALIVTLVFPVVAVILLATKFLFPYHRILALIFYVIGWIPFAYSIYLKRHAYQTETVSFLSAYWVHIVFGVGLLVVLYLFFVLFPVARSPFIGMSREDIGLRIEEDVTVIKYLDERGKRLLEVADQNNIFATSLTSGTEKGQLIVFWKSYLDVLLELDLLKKRYETFYQLNAVTNTELHRGAFMNGYTAFVAQHNYSLELQKRVADHNIVSFLNQSVPSAGVGAGMFDLLQSRITDPDELIRLNAGRVYRAIISDKTTSLDGLVDGYLENIETSIEKYAGMIVEKPLYFLEKNATKLWFPIQKEFAIQLSYVRTSTRAYHITDKQINVYRERFLPGDILLERREWHATNVGIPGYWTHGALYISTLADLDRYFDGLAELGGKQFSEVIREKYPEVYAKFNEKDGHAYAVIEAKRPGVILTSLEESTRADSLAVLRVVGLSKSDRLKVVLQAMSHFGKPYDFNFTFVTDDALVCSELVYKSYQDVPQLSIELQEVNGRPLISPNTFAEVFASEYGTERKQFELVLFLDGNEKTGKAEEKNADEFSTTWQRPKWHIANDFMDVE